MLACVCFLKNVKKNIKILCLHRFKYNTADRVHSAKNNARIELGSFVQLSPGYREVCWRYLDD